MSTPEHKRSLSHVVRRLQIAPQPGLVEALESQTVDEAIEHILADDRPHIPDDEELTTLIKSIEEGDWDGLVKWYMNRITDPAAGFHERMVWFWHGHFTSSVDKTERHHLLRQDRLFRQHALGNFREFLKAVTVDAAMLDWLDGNGSDGEAPNENYAREMMELFALGPGDPSTPNYREDDIRAAARALSGWSVDYETGGVSFDAERHYDRPATFMGERRKWDVDSLIDKICDHPACARHVARSLFWQLAGSEPADAVLDELATKFRAAGLELQALVRAIVAQPSFSAGEPARARTAVEWMAAAMAIFGPENVPFEQWWLEQLAQVPFSPPNVAGWPTDDRWVSASQMLMRTATLMELELSDALVDTLEPTVDAVLAYCGIYAASGTTRSAMQRAIGAQTEFDYGLELLLALALTSPEFAFI